MRFSPRSRTNWALVLGAIAVAVGCGYPTFSYGPGSGGSSATTSSATSIGGGGATTTVMPAGGGGHGGMATASTSTGGGSSSSSTASSSGLAPCGVTHLVISEVRSRGPAGGTDEFVELYNPTAGPILLDATWTLQARSADPTIKDYSPRWMGSNKTIPARGHYLIGSAGYAGGPPKDDLLTASITDGASLLLKKGATVVDAVCYYGTLSELGELINVVTFTPFTCKGTPVANPHNNMSTTDSDTSIERRPGGAAGNCTDTGDNDADFVSQSPSTPDNVQSPPAP